MVQRRVGEPIGLGDLVKDKITGFSGVVVCRAEWLNNCIRYSVQPRELEKGSPVSTESFDEMQLELVKKRAVNFQPVETGGPRPELRRP